MSLSGEGVLQLTKAQNLVKKCKKLNSEFDLHSIIGKGGFGKVFKMKRKSDGIFYAVKMIKEQEYDSEFYKREAKLLSELEHENIVRYFNYWSETIEIRLKDYDAIKSDSSDSETNSTNSRNEIVSSDEDFQIDFNHNDLNVNLSDQEMITFLFIQMGLCSNTSLRNEIDNDLYLDEIKVVDYFGQIANGLFHIHKQNIVHRDLTPENILLTDNGLIKICDFGLSKKIISEGKKIAPGELASGSLSAPCGTSIYMAPEMTSIKSFNAKVDMYSFGVISFEMNTAPMTTMEKCQIFPMTRDKWDDFKYRIEKPYHRTIIKKLLNHNCHKRLSSEDLVKQLQMLKTKIDMQQYFQHEATASKSQQSKLYEKRLQNYTLKVSNTTSWLEKSFVKIFEAHGAINLKLSTFLPYYEEFNDDLTKYINSSGSGNIVATTNNFRIPLAQYIAANNIKSLRTYSFNEIYNNNPHLPLGTKEISFECISPLQDDLVNDAEMLRIASRVCEEFSEHKNDGVVFLINHSLILDLLSKLYSKETIRKIKETLCKPHSKIEVCNLLDREVADFISKIWGPFPIRSASEQILEAISSLNFRIPKICMIIYKAAFKAIHDIVKNANSFGIDNGRIYLSPLLITDRNPSGIMFKIVNNNSGQDIVIGTGGRFDSIVKLCYQQMNRPITKFSAVGISFHVDNILKIYKPTTRKILDVIIYSKDKAYAIPVLTMLQERNFKSEIIHENINKRLKYLIQNTTFVLIRLLGRNKFEIVQMKPRKTEENGTVWDKYELHENLWNLEELRCFIHNDLDSLVTK